MQEAMEDISIIKGVIEHTSKSFTAFSKIFIYWGMLFAVHSILMLIEFSNRNANCGVISIFPLLNYIFPIYALIAALIYWGVSRRVEKHLMKVWVLILIMNVLPPKIIATSESGFAEMTSFIVDIDIFSTVFFSLAVTLITTALFTGYKHLRNLGIIYIGISVIYTFFNFSMFTGSTLHHLLYSVSLPFTFLYVGFFLKSRAK